MRKLIWRDHDFSYVASQRAEVQRHAARQVTAEQLVEQQRQRNRGAVRGGSYALENGNGVRFTDLMIKFYSSKNHFLGSRPYEASADLVANAGAGKLAAEMNCEGAGATCFAHPRVACVQRVILAAFAPVAPDRCRDLEHRYAGLPKVAQPAAWAPVKRVLSISKPLVAENTARMPV